MLIVKITACEKSLEKPGQVGQQSNHHVYVSVCVREREKRELVPQYENGPRHCKLCSLFSRANDTVNVPGEKSLRP